MEHNREPRNRLTDTWAIKKIQENATRKEESSINGVGKLRQIYVKE